MHNRRVPSYFFTQRHRAVHDEFDGLIIPQFKSFFVSSRIIWRSSGENLRCFLATGVHISLFRGSVTSPPMHAGTRYGSDGKKPAVCILAKRPSIATFHAGPAGLGWRPLPDIRAEPRWG